MQAQKHQLSRRNFLRLSAFTATGSLLAACAPTGAPQSATEGGEAAPAQEAVKLALLMVSWNDESRRLYEEELLPAFSEGNPGVTVSPDWTSWGELDAKVMTAFASGLQPDLFQADNVEFGPKYHSRGIIAELDDLVEATADGPAKIGDFYTKAIEEGSKIDGKLMAIPYVLDNRAVFYRKDFFEAEGLDADSTFSSWDGFREAAMALTVRDGENFTRAGWWSNTGWTCYQTYVQFLWQNGGEVLNETQDRVAFDSDAGLEALQFWANLIREDQVGPVEDMPKIGDLNPYTAGQLAMVFQGYGQLLNVQRFEPDLLDSVGTAVLSQDVGASLWYANTFFLSKKDHEQEAWDLLTHLVFDDDNFRQYHEATGGLPPRIATTEQSAHITDHHRVLIDDVMNAAGSHTTPGVPFTLEVLERISEMCQKAIFGQATPEEALVTAADEANQIIQRHLS